MPKRKWTDEQLADIRAYYESPTIQPRPKDVCDKFDISYNMLTYYAKRQQWFPAYKAKQKADKLLSKNMDAIINEEAKSIAEQKYDIVREHAQNACETALAKFASKQPEIKDFHEADKAFTLAQKALGIKEEEGTKLGVSINFLQSPQVIDV